VPPVLSAVDRGDHRLVDQVRAIQTGEEAQYVDSVRRILWLRREFPALVILTGHDHTDYGARLIAGLTDGELADADLSVTSGEVAYWFARDERFTLK
jgi:hypothetical protein